LHVIFAVLLATFAQWLTSITLVCDKSKVVVISATCVSKFWSFQSFWSFPTSTNDRQTS